MTTVFHLNDPPYGNERSYNALRLAVSLGGPRPGSFPEHAATILELVFVNLAACEALFQDVERRAASGRIVGRGGTLPGTAERADDEHCDRNHHREHQDHK